MRFAGKVVIITGAAQGIGAGCARVFCREGGHVALIDRDAKALARMTESLQREGPGQAAARLCDVSQPAQLTQAIAELIAMFGRCDCLINNAGIHPPATPLEATSLELVDHVWRVNFLSTFVACQVAVPHLKATRGTIINMSSMTAVLGQHQSSIYSATKAAQVGLTKSLAIELGPVDIRVNAILPSNVDTPLMREWASSLPDPASALARVADLQVLGRMADPDEIGRVALFLATADSSFMTGQALEVEGGASLDY